MVRSWFCAAEERAGTNPGTLGHRREWLELRGLGGWRVLAWSRRQARPLSAAEGYFFFLTGFAIILSHFAACSGVSRAFTFFNVSSLMALCLARVSESERLLSARTL